MATASPPAPRPGPARARQRPRLQQARLQIAPAQAEELTRAAQPVLRPGIIAGWQCVRGLQGRRIVRVRNARARGDIGKGAETREFAATSLAHGVVQRWRVVGEEQEGRLRLPRFAHEQQRDHRRQQGQGQRRAQRGRIGQHRQALAESAVAHLVVVLREYHKTRGRQVGAGFAAGIAAQVRFALPGESLGQAARQECFGAPGIGRVIAFLLAGQHYMQRVVEVVVPLPW